MTRDANQLAREYARQQREETPMEDFSESRLSPWGMLRIWVGLKERDRGDDPLDAGRCRISLKDGGVIAAYDEDNNAAIYYPWPGMHVTFTPDEGE